MSSWRGMVGRFLLTVCSQRSYVLGLDLLDSAQWEARVSSSVNRGHSSWEQRLWHRGNSPLTLFPGSFQEGNFPDHTLASLTQSHKSFQQRQLWAGHLEKALEGLKPFLWCLQEYSLGNPKEKEIVEPRKATRTFFGLRYFIYLSHNNQINIKNYNMTVEAQLCANHVLHGLSLAITLTLQGRHYLYPTDIEVGKERD